MQLLSEPVSHPLQSERQVAGSNDEVSDSEHAPSTVDILDPLIRGHFHVWQRNQIKCAGQYRQKVPRGGVH